MGTLAMEDACAQAGCRFACRGLVAMLMAGGDGALLALT